MPELPLLSVRTTSLAQHFLLAEQFIRNLTQCRHQYFPIRNLPVFNRH